MAHKKAAGSAKNLRDSNAKYRGLKLFGGQFAKAGNIILRQKGSKYEAGPNTYITNDFSIHAAVDGIVKFFKKKKSRFDGRKYLKTYVSIEPVSEKDKGEAASKSKTVDKKVATKKETKKTVSKEKATTTKAKKASTKKAASSTPKKATAKKTTTTTAKKAASKKAAPKAKKEAKAS